MRRLKHYVSLLVLGVILATAAQSDAGTDSAPGNVPETSALQPQLIEAVKDFRLEAVAEPVAALKARSSTSAIREFTNIEKALFTGTPPRVGWTSYLAASTYSVAPLVGQTSIVLFYHPWSDTAIVTYWQYGDRRFVITHAELVLGDYIRGYGRPPFEAQPLWERESATITPLLAVPLAVGETLAAFENIYPFNGKVGDGWAFAEQRAGFEKNMANKQVSKAMHAAANMRFERGVTALVRYEQDGKLEAYRGLTTLLLSSIKNGDMSGLNVTVPQTSQETIDLIRVNKDKVGQFKVVCVVTTRDDCFVFLSHPADPNNVLVFWFQTDKGKYGLRQASIINHVFSVTYLKQIREVVAKVREP